jgi:hypothetical protein
MKNGNRKGGNCERNKKMEAGRRENWKETVETKLNWSENKGEKGPYPGGGEKP